MAFEPSICVIDDDDSVTDSLRILLECEGFNVVSYASCMDFLRNARKERLDCILLDIGHPDAIEDEFIVQLGRYKTPIIAMTSGPDLATKQLIDRLNAPVLEKPFDARDLLDYVKTAIRGH